MSRSTENVGFVCEHCGRQVAPLDNGSYRNHCLFCLFSKHVDVTPGDRRSACRGLMRPIALRWKSGKGFQIVHLCLLCRKQNANRVAGDATQPDEVEQLIRLM